MPTYLQISTAFRIGKGVSGLHAGVVVGGAEAFYLVVGMKAMPVGLTGVGGAAGGLIAAAQSRQAGGKDIGEFAAGVVETDLARLPAEVTGHSDWPVKQGSGPVLVVPRAAIRSIHYSFWRWGIFLQTDGLEFRIEPPFFGRERLLKALEEMGWHIQRPGVSASGAPLS